MSSIGICEAAILDQTNFENGKMAPWEIFVTPNGTMGRAGLPTVVPFETGKDGQESKSLQFKVGQVRYDPDNKPEQGGGLVLQIATETGTLNLSAHVAVTYHSPKDKRNLAGGLFQWVVDEQVIASHDIGPIENGRNSPASSQCAPPGQGWGPYHTPPYHPPLYQPSRARCPFSICR